MSFVLSMLLFFMIVIIAGWRIGKGKRAGALVTMICLFITVMVIWLGPEPFLKRFHLLSIEKTLNMEGPIAERLLFYKGTFPVIKDFTWIGTGLGTFGTNFARYRNFEFTENFLRHTHNDYLELITETGVGGILFLLIFFGLYVSYLGRVIRKLE